MYKIKNGKTQHLKESEHVILCINCEQPLVYEPRFGWTHVFKGNSCTNAAPMVETAVVPSYKVPESDDEKLALAYLNSDSDLVMGLLREKANINIAAEEVRKNAASETRREQGDSQSSSGRRSSRTSGDDAR